MQALCSQRPRIQPTQECVGYKYSSNRFSNYPTQEYVGNKTPRAQFPRRNAWATELNSANANTGIKTIRPLVSGLMSKADWV